MNGPGLYYGRGAGFDKHFGNPANNRYEGPRDHIVRPPVEDKLGAGNVLPRQDAAANFGRRGPGAGNRPADHNVFGVANYIPQQYWPHQVPARQEPQNLPPQQLPPYAPLSNQQQQAPPPQPQAPPPQQQYYQADPRTLVAAQRQQKKEPAGKIGGDVHVLPARRRAEFLARQQQEEQEAALLRAQQQMLKMQQGGGGLDGQPLPPRDPEEQRWLDAEVQAIQNEIESTRIHQDVLETRRRKLQARLASLGVSSYEGEGVSSQ